MFNVGGGEVLVILVLALVVLGPDKLPQAARTVGKHLADFRRISSGFRQEITNAMDLGAFTDPTPAEPQPAAQPAPTATAPTTSPATAPAPEAAVPAAASPVTTTPQPAPTPAVAATTPAPDDLSSMPVWADGPVDSFV